MKSVHISFGGGGGNGFLIKDLWKKVKKEEKG
jgi:hypothetical protein